METVTVLIAVIASILILCLKPVHGLIIYLLALVWYPSYIKVPVGTIDFSVCRIAIIALFIKIFLDKEVLHKFKFIWLDKIVLIYFSAQLLAGCFTANSLLAFFENRAGAIFDMVLPYFAVRIIIRNKNHCLAFLKGILVFSCPLALFGFYQCITGNNPFGFLQQYAQNLPEYQPLPREGFFRANVTFGVSIMYGLSLAMLGSMCAGLIQNVKSFKFLYISAIILMAIGVVSSVSSGPMLAMMISVAFIAFYRYRKHWKIVVITIILGCLTVEFLSNRHFYDVLGGFTLNSQTAWYRSRLISVALYENGMSGHWLTGFGYDTDPGWYDRIDGRDHTDIVNHYILVLSRFGLIGFIPFIAMNITTFKELIKAYRISLFDSDRWIVWCLSAGLVSLMAAFVSVSLFSQPTTIYYIMIGLAGTMQSVVKSAKCQNVFSTTPRRHLCTVN